MDVKFTCICILVLGGLAKSIVQNNDHLKTLQGPILEKENNKTDVSIVTPLNGAGEATNNDKLTHMQEDCQLEVTTNSTENFSTEVLKRRYNFVYLNLVFNENIRIQEDKESIMYHRWIWTYRGENGGHEYLFLPNDFGYLSFGLLWSYTLVEPMPIEVLAKRDGTCGTLETSEDTDLIVGHALGNMTKKIAAMNDMYNSSYWCHFKRLHIDSNVLFIACEYALCPIQTIEYSCCKFMLDYLTKERQVVCNKHHYHFGVVWWVLPILTGNILFGFYPLLLASFGSRLRSYSRQSRRKMIKLEELSSIDHSKETEYVRMSKHKSPVTFTSAVCGHFTNCNTEGRAFSRFIRLTIIFVPLSLSVTRILLDYTYAGDFVKAAVAKGALVGFSSVIADFSSASEYFLRYIGGPFIALPLFFVLGCLLIVVPNNLEELLEGGLIEFTGKASFLLTLSPESKAWLAGEQIRKCSGYKRIQKTLLSQILMLFNRRFWKQILQLMYTRYINVIYPVVKSIVNNTCLTILLAAPVLLLYLAFCVIELVVSCTFFAFPVICSFFIFIKAYVKYARGIFDGRSGMSRVLSFLAVIIVILMFLYTWYLYCLLFFDAFWFLSRMAIFTYTGIIAYPRLSYGYLIICLMALYYIAESFNSFRHSYRDLLSLSIKACQKVEEKMQMHHKKTTILYEDGIPVDLWNLIVDRHRPRRIQVAYTVFQLCIIIFVLTISLELLFRFDKVRELSLITHVFTALMICALPKIVKSTCTHGLKHRQQKKLLWKIKQTVRDYLNDDIETEETDIFDFHDRNEYERLVD